MNNEETIELFQDGVEAWNDWADRMLSTKRQLQDSGDWNDGPEADWNEATRRWHQEAKADFWDYDFSESAHFTSFRFPGVADFGESTFEQYVDFSGAEFHQEANFSNSTFANTATFNETTFKQNVSFSQSKFSGILIVERATFSADAAFLATTISRFGGIQETDFFGNAMFSQSNFEVPIHIGNSKFRKNTSFMAVSGRGLFLRNVEFARLPSFQGAHFDEAPQFDRVDLDPYRLNRVDPKPPASVYSASWRALRRLAAQGHDHERELQFFKGEIIARRGTLDRWFHPRFWAGLFYEIFSDFGRSLALPLAWLFLSIWLFTGVYASHSPDLSEVAPLQEVPCISGFGNARVAAWTLSIHNAFPFTGIGSSGKLEQVYACLYGTQAGSSSAQEPLITGLYPDIPDSVAFLGGLQFILSAVLVFLFVLAIRNLFRIR